jgi:hypothetical protein
LHGAWDHQCEAVIEDQIVRVWSSRQDDVNGVGRNPSTEIESFVGVVVLQVHHSIFIRQEHFYGVVRSPSRREVAGKLDIGCVCGNIKFVSLSVTSGDRECCINYRFAVPLSDRRVLRCLGSKIRLAARLLWLCLDLFLGFGERRLSRDHGHKNDCSQRRQIVHDGTPCHLQGCAGDLPAATVLGVNRY